MKCWWERRSGQWWEFDKDINRSYYKFLRAVHGMKASEAWSRVKLHLRDRKCPVIWVGPNHNQPTRWG